MAVDTGILQMFVILFYLFIEQLYSSPSDRITMWLRDHADYHLKYETQMIKLCQYEYLSVKYYNTVSHDQMVVSYNSNSLHYKS